MFLLYEMFEMQKVASQPLHAWAKTTKHLLDHADLSHNPMGRVFAASHEMLERATRVFKRPDFQLDTCTVMLDGKTIAADVSEEVVFTQPYGDLLYFKRTVNGVVVGQDQPKMLVVAPMSGHFSTLLRDTVAAMLPDFNVFITDWHDAKMVPLKEGDFNLDDYVTYIIKMLQHLGRKTHVLAVCQPAVPVMVAASVMAERGDEAQPMSMTLMGGPIDTSVNPGSINTFAQEHNIEWFEKNAISVVPAIYPGAGRRVMPGFIILGNFISMNPDRHRDAHYRHFVNMMKGDDASSEKHRKFYDEYLAVMDLCADYFLESVYHVFQAFSLARGNMPYQGKKINPALITKTALLTVEGEKDDISCPGQTKPAHDLCRNIPSVLKNHHLQKDAGHYGIFSGARWRNEVLPIVREFVKNTEDYFKKEIK